MSRHTPLYSWIGQVVSAFPRLSRPQATVLESLASSFHEKLHNN